jgi:hypothetical protein
MYVAFLTALALSTAVQTAPARAHIDVGSSTHAAAARQGGRAAIRFGEMDTNNDGVITRSEWRGSAESFRVHDWNRDGVLSGDEVRPGAYRNDPYDERDYNRGDSLEFSSWTAAAFANLDTNRDGRISTREWHFEMDTFRRVDRDRDGMLSRAEFLGENQDDDRNDQFG